MQLDSHLARFAALLQTPLVRRQIEEFLSWFLDDQSSDVPPMVSLLPARERALALEVKSEIRGMGELLAQNDIPAPGEYWQ